MPTVSGRLVFDPERNANINGLVEGLSNVPIMLQNTATNSRLLVLTDVTGAYTFLNVPAGNYRIVEAYGEIGAVPTPGDFATAVPGPVLVATVPPIDNIPNHPPEANMVDCVTPNTILITVAADDILNQNIFNGPILYTPLQLTLDPCTVIFPENLVTDAAFGTFGSFFAGTLANTGPATNPYPALTPDFTYVVPDPGKYTPTDGEFTVQNTMNNAMSNVIGAWWRISDHTTGNETGRMMIVNEDDPGGIILRTTVPVAPNSTYLFSTWIMNLFRVAGYPGPQFALRILDDEGNIMYSAPLGFQIPANAEQPEWKEIGTVINSQASNALIFEFFSQGEATVGNDFAIDDISLRLVRLPQFTLEKTQSQATAQIGDLVTYTLALSNLCEQPLLNIRFWDYIPPEVTFIPGSVVINGVADLNANPLVGFPVPDTYGGEMLRVTFQVRVEAVPNPNPLVNQAMIQYLYTPVPGGFADVYNLYSNPLPLLVEGPLPQADLLMEKNTDRTEAVSGACVTYTIRVFNNGPSDAVGVVLHDRIPPALTHVQYSLDSGVSWQPWTGSYVTGFLGNQQQLFLLIRGHIAQHVQGFVANTATVTAQTPDPNPNNNSSTVRILVRPICQPIPPCTPRPCCFPCGGFWPCCACCHRDQGCGYSGNSPCGRGGTYSQWIACGCE